MYKLHMVASRAFLKHIIQSGPVYVLQDIIIIARQSVNNLVRKKITVPFIILTR